MRFFRKAKELKAGVVLNPKYYKLVRLPAEQNEYIVSVFMKIAGRFEKYNDFKEVELGIVIELKSFCSKNEITMNDAIQVCHILSGCSYEKLVRLKIHDICQMYKFAIDGLDMVYELEKNLIRKLKARDHKAGIDRMNKFSDLICLKTVADFYNETLEQAEKRPYKQAYIVWYMEKEKADIDAAYIELNKHK